MNNMNYKKLIYPDGHSEIWAYGNGTEYKVDDDQGEYVAWLAEGNTPEEITIPDIDLSTLQTQLIDQLSSDSFQARWALIPAYRELNMIRAKLATGNEMSDITSSKATDMFSTSKLSAETTDTETTLQTTLTDEETYPYTLEDCDNISQACRDEFYRVKTLILQSETQDDARDAYAQKNFPTSL